MEAYLDIQREALDELLNTVEDALKEQNDAISNLIDLKKRLLEDTWNEADYESEVASRVKENPQAPGENQPTGSGQLQRGYRREDRPGRGAQ